MSPALAEGLAQGRYVEQRNAPQALRKCLSSNESQSPEVGTRCGDGAGKLKHTLAITGWGCCYSGDSGAERAWIRRRALYRPFQA